MRTSPATGAVRLFDHTADVGLDLSGATLGDLFAWAAAGLTRVALGPRAARLLAGPGAGEAQEVAAGPLEARDLEALLVAWLNFLIYLIEAERTVPVASDVEVVPAGEGWSLRGRVRAVPVPPAGLRVRVKAATFHGLKVVKTRSGLYRARVILDV
ncbi:MAG: archease [Firmicutes bacterium]|nr:archease [Bacillota bacterium]